MKRTGVLLIAASCAAISSCVPRTLVAPATHPQDLFPDTSAWKPILAYATDWIRPVSGVRDVAPTTPWIIELPSAEDPWPSVQATLSSNLAARAAVPSDSTYRMLRITPLRVRGDTAEVQLVTGRHRRCPEGSGTSGHENAQSISVVRVSTPTGPQWSAARSGMHAAGSYVCFDRT